MFAITFLSPSLLFIAPPLKRSDNNTSTPPRTIPHPYPLTSRPRPCRQLHPPRSSPIDPLTSIPPVHDRLPLQLLDPSPSHHAMPLPVPRPAHNRPTSTSTPTPKQSQRTPPKPALNMSNDAVNPAQWLNFSLPPRQRAVPGSGVIGVPRRSRRGEGWRGGVLSRERYVHANFRFVLKPTETLSYGAHFADPDM